MSEQPKQRTIEIVKVKKTAPEDLPTRIDNKQHEREVVRNLLEGLIKEVVSYPEDVSVSFSTGENTTLFKVDCTQRVIGQLLGSQGKTIGSLRILIMGISARKGFRSIIDIPYFDAKKFAP